MLNRRVTHRSHFTYNTKRNRYTLKKVKNGLSVKYLPASQPHTYCNACNVKLSGLKAIHSKGKQFAKKSDLTVNRAYGAFNCGSCVRNRIVRAFLSEEERIVKKFLEAKAAAQVQEAAAQQ